MRTYIFAAAPFLWARVSRQGKVKQQGEVQSLADFPSKLRSDEIYAVVPGEFLVTNEVFIPSRNRNKVKQALPFALEEKLSEEIDSFHFLILNWNPGENVIAAVLSRKQLSFWQEQFANAGFVLSGLVAEYQLLPIHPRTNITIATQPSGKTSIHWANGIGVTLDSALVDIWWNQSVKKIDAAGVNSGKLAQQLLLLSGETSPDVKEWKIGSTFPEWIQHWQKGVNVQNLLGQTRATTDKRARTPGLRLAILLLVMAMAGKLGIDGYEYVQLEAMNSQFGKEMSTLLTETFPSEKRVVNAKAQFRQKLAELQQGGNTNHLFQQLLVLISPSIRSGRAEIQEISFREGVLDVHCAVNRFSDLDSLKGKFEQGGVLKAELTSSGSLGTKVTGRFKIQLGNNA